MDFKTNFEDFQSQLEAMPMKDVKEPNMPIDVLTNDAEELAIEAEKDREALSGAGLDYNLVDSLNSLSGALRYIQALWMSEFRARKEAQKDWLDKSPSAYDLRNDLLHHFTFAFREQTDVLSKVRRIREGNGHADMIQDLLELAVLGEKYPESLAKINYPVALNEKARQTSKEMAELLAEANGAKDSNSEAKLLRDKAFTLLNTHLSEIREYGRYVFWKNEERKKKYLNEYR